MPARAGYFLFLFSSSNLREVSVHVEGEIGYITREHVIVPTLIICLFIFVPKNGPCISCAKSMPNCLLSIDAHFRGGLACVRSTKRTPLEQVPIRSHVNFKY